MTDADEWNQYARDAEAEIAKLRAELTEAKLLLEATREYVVDAIFATEHSLKGYEKLITQKTAPDRDLLREIDAAMAGGE